MFFFELLFSLILLLIKSFEEQELKNKLKSFVNQIIKPSTCWINRPNLRNQNWTIKKKSITVIFQMEVIEYIELSFIETWFIKILSNDNYWINIQYVKYTNNRIWFHEWILWSFIGYVVNFCRKTICMIIHWFII